MGAVAGNKGLDTFQQHLNDYTAFREWVTNPTVQKIHTLLFCCGFVPGLVFSCYLSLKERQLTNRITSLQVPEGQLKAYQTVLEGIQAQNPKTVADQLLNSCLSRIKARIKEGQLPVTARDRVIASIHNSNLSKDKVDFINRTKLWKECLKAEAEIIITGDKDKVQSIQKMSFIPKTGKSLQQTKALENGWVDMFSNHLIVATNLLYPKLQRKEITESDIKDSFAYFKRFNDIPGKIKGGEDFLWTFIDAITSKYGKRMKRHIQRAERMANTEINIKEKLSKRWENGWVLWCSPDSPFKATDPASRSRVGISP